MLLDVSPSMLDSDPNKLSNEAIKMFIDMSSLKGDKVGVIAFANDVVSKKELVNLQTEADKQALKGFIDSLGKYPYTDLSVGVTEAIKMLDNSHEKDYFPLIVLLTDGNNDVDKTKGKTNKQADDDLAHAVAAAKENGYPIYTIGLNANGQLNKDVLKNVAESTNGKFFETSNANDLPGILSEIYADHLKLKIVPMKDVVAQNDFQDVPFNVPNGNVLEANISLISSNPVEIKLVDPSGNEQTVPSDKVLLTKSKSYSLLKLINPAPGNWIMKVKGFPKDKIDINLVFNYDLQLKLAPLSIVGKKTGDTVKVSAYFEDNGKQIANLDLYKTMKAVLFVKNSVTGKTEEIPLNADAKGFAGQLILGGPADYEVSAKAEGNSFYRETQAVKLTVQPASIPGTSEQSPLKKSSSFPWLNVLLTIAGVGVLAALTSSILKRRSQANRGFSGKLVMEIRNEDTGVSSEPQYMKMKKFKGEFYLGQMFVIGPELEEANQISFKPLTENSLLLLNQSPCTIEKDGEVIDAETGQRLKRNDKLRIILEQGHRSIYIENIS
jgi:uncharacterized protein YegL